MAVERIFQLDSSRICIFRNVDAVQNSARLNWILGKITREVPTFTTEINKSNYSHHEVKSDFLNSDFYIIIEAFNNFDFQKIMNTLKTIAKSNPRPPRSKTLLILLDSPNAFNIDSDLKRSLNNAWALKKIRPF